MWHAQANTHVLKSVSCTEVMQTNKNGKYKW